MHLSAAPAPPPFSDAFARASEMAGAVPGAYATAPCRFVELPAEVAGEAGRHVLAVCQRAPEEGHQTHLRERSLTAAQRFILSLACDGIDAVWSAELPDEDRLRAAGVPLGGGVAVGVIRCRVG